MIIQELLRKYRIEFAIAGEHHHARPNWIAVRKCPFCSSQNYHLGFNLTDFYFSCWKCKGHGVIPTLLRLGVPYDVAAAFYRGKSFVPRDEREKRGALVEPAGRGELQKSHCRYLQGRGFDPDEIKSMWEVEGIGMAGGRLSWRIFIPIIHRGERVSWTARAIGDESPLRYISASASEEALNHKHLLYGIDLCQHTVIAVEGPTDAWNIGPGAVALFGIAFTSAQVLLLSQFPNRFVCFDSSTDAQIAARNLASQLAPFPGNTTVIKLKASDPGKAKLKEISALRKLAGLSKPHSFNQGMRFFF